MTETISWGIDCIGSSVGNLVVAGAKPGAIWPYCTGSDGIAWSPGEIDHFRKQGAKVFLVNQGYEQTPDDALHGDEFDYESGAWRLADLMQVIANRRKVSWSTRVYCAWSGYAEIKQLMTRAGITRSVFFRIADWNLDQYMADLELHGDVYAGQWASPTSNPSTLIPGTTMTLAEANADLSVFLRIPTGWAG
jgi:hypothetical protein